MKSPVLNNIGAFGVESKLMDNLFSAQLASYSNSFMSALKSKNPCKK